MGARNVFSATSLHRVAVVRSFQNTKSRHVNDSSWVQIFDSEYQGIAFMENAECKRALFVTKFELFVHSFRCS